VNRQTSAATGAHPVEGFCIMPRKEITICHGASAKEKADARESETATRVTSAKVTEPAHAVAGESRLNT
jgi:hypothetical protein